MSEIRRVKITIKEKATAIQVCNEMNLGVEEISKEVIKLANTGIHVWGNQAIKLIKQQDGSYILEGDCSTNELEKLAGKIKAQMSIKIITREAARIGYNVASKIESKGKIKIRLRTFA